MFGDILSLLFGLVLILFAAEGFTNGIESLGRRFSLSQAVVGSLLAAVGTALPETILPIVAILFYGGASAQDIGVGAILGAPFMLSTLAFFLVGATVIVSWLMKRRNFNVRVETHSLRRDLVFFICLYSLTVFVPLAMGRAYNVVLTIILVGGYITYAWLTFRGESGEIEHTDEMYLWRIIRKTGLVNPLHPTLPVILIQVAGALFVMVMGAHTFVKHLEHVSIKLGMNPLLFALLLAPIATELPEKFNSVTWSWKGRDSLAIGNITGAMVFQSTFPVSVGLLFTEWHLTGMALFSAILALVSALAVLLELTLKKRLSPASLLCGGGLYLAYMIVLIINNN